MKARDVAFIGNPTKSGAACDQDAFLIGGTDTTSGNSTTSMFQGYGSSFENCTFDHIRRGFYGRNAGNAFQIGNPVWSLTCGSDATAAAIEFDGTGLDGVGNLVINPVIEMNNYVYGVKLGPHGQHTFINPGFYDGSATTLACFRLEGGSVANIAIGGWYSLTGDKFVSSDGTASNSITILRGSGMATPFVFGGPTTKVQPNYPTGSESTRVFEVKRSANEPVNPDMSLLTVSQSGQVSASGPTPKFVAGTVTHDATGLIQATGNLSLYAAADTNRIIIQRGLLSLRHMATSARPAATIGAGTIYHDDTLGFPVYSDGTVWRKLGTDTVV